ncbi:hypothetical protein ACKGJI_08845 [Sulfurospirillum sp. 1307]
MSTPIVKIQDNSSLDVNALTGEIHISADENEYEQLKSTKIKALKLLNKDDFCLINGIWEAKRDGLIKILSSLPLSYAWEIKDKEIHPEFAQVSGTLTIKNGNILRIADSIGICELSELRGSGGLHFMNARAETRALKRAIEVLFGSVINYFVINHLNTDRAFTS